MKSYGQIAYEAYSSHTDGKSLVSGAELPKWDELRKEIKEAWKTASKAVIKDIKSKIGCYICGINECDLYREGDGHIHIVCSDHNDEATRRSIEKY